MYQPTNVYIIFFITTRIYLLVRGKIISNRDCRTDGFIHTIYCAEKYTEKSVVVFDRSLAPRSAKLVIRSRKSRKKVEEEEKEEKEEDDDDERDEREEG